MLLKELAEKAGVSPGTVSHVLNANSKARIAPETRDRVLRLSVEMGYHPNHLAASLGRGRSNTLGLLISGLRNPFFVTVLEEAEALAAAAGYQILTESAPSHGGTYSTHQRLPGYPLDGCLAWANEDQTVDEFLGRRAAVTPIVYLGYPRNDLSDWVAFDLAEAGRLAARALIASGARRFAFLTPYKEAKVRQETRFLAFEHEIQSSGSLVEIVTTEDEQETRESGRRLAERLAARERSERPDGILAHNDILAIGAYTGLVRAGLKLPRDVRLIGVDGIEEGRYLPEPLTTVRLDAETLVRAAMGILLDRLTSTQLSPSLSASGRSILVPPIFLPGGTV